MSAILLRKIWRTLLGILCAAITLALTGCWDMMEINERVYVVGVGIDTTPATGLYEYSFQLAVPSGADNAVSENNISYESISVTADSFARAVQDLSSACKGATSFEHLSCVVLGKDAAHEDIAGMLEYLLRWSYVRRQSVVVCTDSDAKSLLDCNYITGSSSLAISNLAEGFYGSRASDGTLTLSRLQVALSAGSGFCLPRVSAVDGGGIVDSAVPSVVAESKAATVSDSDAAGTDSSRTALLVISGINVYSKGKLCGTLEAQEAELSRLFSGGQDNGIITAAQTDSALFHYQIVRSSCVSRCSIANDRPIFELSVTVSCKLVDSGGSVPPDGDVMAEKQIALSLEKSLRALIQRCGEMGGSAPLQIEDDVRQTNYDWYNDNRSRWESSWSPEDIALEVHCILEG